MSLIPTNGHVVSNFAKNGRYASINFNLNTDRVKQSPYVIGLLVHVIFSY